MPPEIKTCNACGGDLKPVDEFVQAYKKEFVEMLGKEPKVSPNFNCINCGLIYDEQFVNTGNVISWFPQLKIHYEKMKEKKNV